MPSLTAGNTLFVLDKQLSVEICAHYPALVAEVVLLPPLLFKCFEEEKKVLWLCIIKNEK